MMNVRFSRRLAVVGGIGLPLIEIVRRWRTLPGPVETWMWWLDDFVLGAILLTAAWLSRPRAHQDISTASQGVRFRRNSWLTAAWGFVCGAGLFSTLGQINHWIDPSLGDDPSGVAHGYVVLVKAALVGIGLFGMFASMREDPPA